MPREPGPSRRWRAKRRAPRGTFAHVAARHSALGVDFPPFACSGCGVIEAPARFGSGAIAARLTGAAVCWSCDFWRALISSMAGDPASWLVAGGRVWKLSYRYVPGVETAYLVRWHAGGAMGVAAAVDVGELPPAWRAVTPDTGTIGPYLPSVAELRASIARDMRAEYDARPVDFWKVIDAGKPGAG